METIRCRKWIFGKDIFGGGVSVQHHSDIDLTFNLDIVTLTFKIMFLGYISEFVRCSVTLV